jgi:predicted transcriptional regulator
LVCRKTFGRIGKGEEMTVQELAEKANVTERRVYQIAKKLGRLPTIEEIESRKGKRGRPKKYKWEEEDERSR